MVEERDGIEAYRLEIDLIDSELLRLFNRRASCAMGIGKIKKANNQPITVPEREQSVIDRMNAENTGPLQTDAIRSLYSEIFHQMKLLEGEVD